MLTTTKVDRLQTPSKIERHIDSDGLYLELTPKGSRRWRYRHKSFTGSWTMKSLGKYSEVDLHQARKLRNEFKNTALYKEVSFEQAASEWLEYKGYSSLKNKKIVQRKLSILWLSQGLMFSQSQFIHLN